MKKMILFSSLILLVCLFLFNIYSSKSIYADAVPQNESVVKNDETVTIDDVNETVYALTNVSIRTLPNIDADIVTTAVYGDEFKRTGITSNGWSRLELPDSGIVYSLSLAYSTEKPKERESKIQLMDSERIQLPVNYISQLPELPTGCEVTALATVLNYWGYNIDKLTLADKYLPKGPIGSTDFNVAFVGNPRDASSYGCYAGAIITAATNYLIDAGGTHEIYNISGYTKDELYAEVKSGYPVIIWGTLNNSEPQNTANWNVDGKTISWVSDHSYVLIGYDRALNTVIVSDPLNGIKEYDADLFFTRYQQLYSQALVIK